MLALLSVWIALGALVTSIVLVFYRGRGIEMVLTLLPYTVAFSATLAAAALWRVRKQAGRDPGVAGQRLQAGAAIGIDTITLAIVLIWANGLMYGLTGLAIEIGFLSVCYWGYTRVVLRE